MHDPVDDFKYILCIGIGKVIPIRTVGRTVLMGSDGDRFSILFAYINYRIRRYGDDVPAPAMNGEEEIKDF